MRALVISFSLLVSFLSIAPATAKPIVLPFDATVHPGEAASIRFRFDVEPTALAGDADIFLVNGGSVSQGLLGTSIDIYARNRLIGSYSNTRDLSAFSIFTSPSTSYTLFSNPTDLSSLFFDGAVGLLVYRPVFDPSFAASAFVDYQFSTLGAFRGVGTDTLVGGYPQPRVLNVHVHAIPEPSTLALLGFGLAALALARRRKLK